MFTAILLAVTATVPGAGPDTAAPPPAATTSSAVEQRYCVEGTPTGSIIATRECHTRAEWLKLGFDPLSRHGAK